MLYNVRSKKHRVKPIKDTLEMGSDTKMDGFELKYDWEKFKPLENVSEHKLENYIIHK